MIILLYSKGITTREISDIIEKMYGQHYSAQTISKLSETVAEEAEAFRNRPIKPRYTALFCDATFINVRRDTVAKEALHVIIGIDPNGYKEVLSYSLYPEEVSGNYREMLEDLKERGLKEVLVFVSDGLTGLADALTDSFPRSRHQSCWTHLIRNTANKVRARDKADVMEDLRPVYRAKDRKEAERELESFIEKWGDLYPKMVKMYQGKNNLFTFMDFPESVRPSLYNISECLNKQLKRRTKVKEQFPNENSLDMAVYCFVAEYNATAGNRVHKGFRSARFEIERMFEQAYETETKTEKIPEKSPPWGRKALGD